MSEKESLLSFSERRRVRIEATAPTEASAEAGGEDTNLRLSLSETDISFKTKVAFCLFPTEVRPTDVGRGWNAWRTERRDPTKQERLGDILRRKGIKNNPDESRLKNDARYK